MKCPGSAALVPTMTCVTDADVRNSHNRQKAAEYLMAFEKCFLASSHTKKKIALQQALYLLQNAHQRRLCCGVTYK